MPANYPHPPVYTYTGDPDTMNVSSLYKPGELGARLIETRNRQYQLVQLDSGCVAGVGPGVAAANQLAFWKDKSKYIVTNNSAQAIGANAVAGANSSFRTQVAGIIRAAVTAGNYCFVLQQGRSISVKSTSSTSNIGDSVVANTGTSADAAVIACGTALVAQKAIGTLAAVASSSTTLTVDLDIPGID